jgi:signal transduction histidine kinase
VSADGLQVASATVAGGWLVTAWVCAGRGHRALGGVAALLGVVQAVATAWPAAAPVALAAWLGGALALPEGRLRTHPRRWATAAAGVGGLTWTVAAAVEGTHAATGPLVAVALTSGGILGVAAALRSRRASATHDRTVHWVTAAGVLVLGAGAVLVAMHVLIEFPDRPLPWLVGALLLVPCGVVLGKLPGTARVAERALVEAVVASGLAGLVVAVYVVVVIGLGRRPVGDERDVLASSFVAALVVCILAVPTRVRLAGFGRTLLGGGEPSPEVALATFGARMSRSVPFDELLLQLAESLRATLGPAGAEVWVGAGGVLSRAVSVPERGPARLERTEHERGVVARTRVGGAGWMRVWLPQLADDVVRDRGETSDASVLRVAPAAHAGQLLGLLLVRRPAGADEFSEEDDRVLVELARQVALALHNVQLDSALQASLEELSRRNAELQASRLRIVTAADASRRAIERDLHDGAQQHLVALSVKLSLVEAVLDEDPKTAGALVEELRGDVKTTIAALRELAHGIYPPLLRNHGLDQALRSATHRAALPCTVVVELPVRYPEEVEAAVYFCCLEAIQNAGKYAGDGASVTVRIDTEGERLRFAVADDGVGFATGPEPAAGVGFVNMGDRLGAVGGRLWVESAPGAGTTVRGEIPVSRREPRADAPG